MLPAKCLIQLLWCENKDWDEPLHLDEEDQTIWEELLGYLMKLSVLKRQYSFMYPLMDPEWPMVPCVMLDTYFLMAWLRSFFHANPYPVITAASHYSLQLRVIVDTRHVVLLKGI